MNIVELCILQMMYILGVYDTCKWDMCSSPYHMLLWKTFCGYYIKLFLNVRWNVVYELDINSEYKKNKLATMTKTIMCKWVDNLSKIQYNE
jgi:hypothetical protein